MHMRHSRKLHSEEALLYTEMYGMLTLLNGVTETCLLGHMLPGGSLLGLCALIKICMYFNVTHDTRNRATRAKPCKNKHSPTRKPIPGLSSTQKRLGVYEKLAGFAAHSREMTAARESTICTMSTCPSSVNRWQLRL